MSRTDERGVKYDGFHVQEGNSRSIDEGTNNIRRTGGPGFDFQFRVFILRTAQTVPNLQSAEFNQKLSQL
jgi:hypothetical protein